MSPPLRCGPYLLSLDRTLLMGILNVTPDSFSDGGQYLDPGIAADRARTLVAAGADVIDIGAESTRPGARPVSAAQELDRLMPLFEALGRDGGLRVPVSIDTSKPEVADQALGNGAQIINDISGADEQILAVAHKHRAPVIAMHMQGSPRSMQSRPSYDDVVAEVTHYLAERKLAAEAAGVQVILDPGIGFGKTLEHNLALLAGLGHITQLGAPVLVGTSRKSFLGAISGREVDDRVDESVASGLFARRQGAQVLRVHDVAAHRAALDVVERLEQAQAADHGSKSLGATAVDRTIHVFARNLEVWAHIGTTPAERSRAQALHIDLEVQLSKAGEVRDHQVGTTLDYVALECLAREICRASEAHLLETLAATMADTIVERFSVDEVFVRITKPAVGQMRHGGDFGVELRRSGE